MFQQKSHFISCSCTTHSSPHCHMIFESSVKSVADIPPHQPDEASQTCDSPKCRSSFNLFVRKHHCRHCGHIFCAEHTAYTIPLNQDARFHPDGFLSRACDACYQQYQRWDTARSIRRKNSNDTEGAGKSESPPAMNATGSCHRRIMSGHVHAGKTPELAASSVPRDWAWSTF